MINPINHYAITSGQPGVINEEAYTTLQLVGECGQKINEIIPAVNEASGLAGQFDERITAAQETADNALSIANENEQRITNVSSVAQEGRSVAYAAREAANDAQDAANAAQDTANAANATADKAFSGTVELEQIADNGAALNYIDQYGNLSVPGNAYVKSLLNKCMAKIKINLLQLRTKTLHYMFGVQGKMDTQGVYNNGFVDIFINLTANAQGRFSVGFAFKILCAATADSQSVQGQEATFSYESSGGIAYANFTANGIGPDDFFISGSGFGGEIGVQF
jgi:hypothetical protein